MSKIEVLPSAYRDREQTFIKHLILKQYLERLAWNILSFRPEFVFVDGFSGPWASVSDNYADTSFGIALDRLRSVREKLKEARNLVRDVRCIFVEERTAAYQKLSKAVQDASDIHSQALHGRFEDQIDNIIDQLGDAFSLISIDPTGWNFDLRKLAPLLRREPSEVIINFMFEHINRFIDHPEKKIRESYARPFGLDNWREKLDLLFKQGLDREDAVLELFKSQLKKLGNFPYVISTRVRHAKAERAHYYLVYGTRNLKGLKEFRKVEREAMKAEELYRNTAKVERKSKETGMNDMFGIENSSAFNVENHKLEIRNARITINSYLKGSSALLYEDILAAILEKFMLIETEVKDLLVIMQKEKEIRFENMPPRKSKPDKGILISYISS